MATHTLIKPVSTDELKERVQAGIQFLDENYAGWFNKIDLEKLDISKLGKCIVGQLDLYKEIKDYPSELGFGKKKSLR